jgi:hypothetical protein
MNARTIASLVAAGRIGVGLGLTFAPTAVTRPWIGEVAETTGARVLSAGFGTRDLAVGLGTANALRSRESVREWLLAGLLCDAADLLATLAGRRGLPSTGVAATSALAASGIVLGAVALRGLDQPEP